MEVREMAGIIDVAQYIAHKKGRVTAMKLQKLCFYCQAWTLAWDNIPLFDEDFEAWANGPVCAHLYALHKGVFAIDSDTLGKYSEGCLTAEQIKNIDQVLDDYWEFAPHQLSAMTHKELPWRQARAGLLPGEPGNSIISKESMLDFYSGLLQDE
jgi:uncharacterized phage-associated protein